MATSSVLLIGKETDTVRSIAQALAAVDCHCERARGSAGAICWLRQQSFDVVITHPDTTIDEGLALIEEMRDIRPGMKAILLAPSSTPEEIIAALRARVFVCFSAPFDVHEIASFACRAATARARRATRAFMLPNSFKMVSIHARTRRATLMCLLPSM